MVGGCSSVDDAGQVRHELVVTDGPRDHVGAGRQVLNIVGTLISQGWNTKVQALALFGTTLAPRLFQLVSASPPRVLGEAPSWGPVGAVLIDEIRRREV